MYLKTSVLGLIAVLFIVTTCIYIRNGSPDYDTNVAFSNEVNTEKLIYNMVPKTGCTTLMSIIDKLDLRNNFSTFYEPNNYNPRLETPGSELGYVFHINNVKGPLLFRRHTYFVDFNRYKERMPLYINMVRDPLERQQSLYYYIRYFFPHKILEDTIPLEERRISLSKCMEMNLKHCIKEDGMIPYFCGNEEFCTYDKDKSLAKAKENIERHYQFVGISEEFNLTLIALEKIIPRFFAGAYGVYKDMKKDLNVSPSKNMRPSIDKRARIKIIDKLRHEYELYYFIKQRFYAKLVQLNITPLQYLVQDID
ncbi:unnamed protein product [Owenia fusiformis]|uniref:Uncharacterized protein n=1 Tax=Owenia fusiformis TaxID=6347 RepID=A0A8J1TYG5_OWEFU|nr:unnamed protein product [Owenia fusiformis]